MSLWIKICGITTEQDGLAAAAAGADAVGLVFWPGSRRCVSPDLARRLVSGLPPKLARVGVFVDERPETMLQIARHVGLTHLQLHGAEPPAYLQCLPLPVIKAVRLRGPVDLSRFDPYLAAPILLVEPYAAHTAGGAGLVLDPALARQARQRLKALGFDGRLLLAGGLHAGNVAEAMRAAEPDGVDVSSGVESDRAKDPVKIHTFVAAARAAAVTGGGR